MLRSAKRLLVLIVVTVSTGAALFTPVGAVSAGEWQAGRIIDDGVFFQRSTLSVDQIQTFLNSRVPVCDTQGAQMYTSTQTRAQYAASKGYSTPFTCLKDYSMSWNERPADIYCRAIPGGSGSAATILHQVSNACEVDTKALIVMLEKEQGLISDDWPWTVQYRSALGYGCPDTAACDAAYYGFFNQVYNAARQFNVYAANPGSYRHAIGSTVSVYYHPDLSRCGSAPVYLQNKATAGLYNYTPYQPDQSALNNLYGLGGSCSAYGNRNFWRLYNDWFGSTYAPAYSWQLERQYVYTDETKTTAAGLSGLMSGERRFVGFTAKNTGNTTWQNTGNSPVNLGTSHSLERTSKFLSTGWLSGSRPVRLKESSVAPGQVGTFEFWITAPYVSQDTTFNEYFTPVAENQAWFNDIGLFYSISVQAPRYTWSMASQYAFTDESKVTPTNMNSLLPGQRVYVGFTAKNTGNMTWSNNGPNALMAGTLSPFERTSKFSPGSNWLTGTRPALMKEASVGPGQIGTFEYWLTIPSSGVGGIYNERFGLIANNLTWLNDTGLSYYMNVRQ